MQIEERLANYTIAPSTVWERIYTFITLDTGKKQTPEEQNKE